MSSAAVTILQEMRTAIAAIATSRDASKLFLEHKTSEPFERAPLKGRDGFYLRAHVPRQRETFGKTGKEEMEWIVDLLLGHAPFAQDYKREEWLIDDTKHLYDVLENRVWAAAAVQAVWPLAEQAVTDRNDPNWWITTMPLRIVYLETILTS